MKLTHLVTLDAVFQAQEAQDLPPFPGTSVHGALLRSARGVVCTQPARTACEGCPERNACRYPALFEPVLAVKGRAERDVPAPVSLRTDRSRAAGPLRLETGDRLRVSTTLIGEAAIADRSLLISGLHGVALRGMGIDAAGEQFQHRPRLQLLSIEEAAPIALKAARAYELELVSPLRLKTGGQVRGTLDAASLWAGIIRRVRALSSLYGGDVPALPGDAPFRLESIDTRVVEVTRYSSRQGKRMSWPGVVGSATLQAATPDDTQLAALLSFISEVQLGKGTLFGLGVVKITPLDEA